MERATQPPTSTSTNDEALAELRERASLSESATFQASYILRVSSQDGPSINVRLTWYQADGMVRADFDGQVGSEGVSAIVIPGPGYPEEEFLYVCPYGEGGGTCYQWRAVSEAEAYPPEAYAAVLASQFVGGEEFTEAMIAVRSEPPRTFLTERSACFTGAGAEAEGTICVTPEGITLMLELESGGETVSLTATELSRDIAGGVFELPFELSEEPLPKR